MDRLEQIFSVLTLNSIPMTRQAIPTRADTTICYPFPHHVSFHANTTILFWHSDDDPGIGGVDGG